MEMYKQFRLKNGKLYPLFVYANEETPMNMWLEAKEGPRNDKGKVKSRLGALAYRPGWHLSEFPYAPHIGVKDKSGKIVAAHPDSVWAVCEVSDEHDYTPEIPGKHPKDRYMKNLPKGGFYWYNTNPNAVGRWMIAHKIKVLRVLTQDEVEHICMTKGGFHAQPVLASDDTARGNVWTQTGF